MAAQLYRDPLWSSKSAIRRRFRVHLKSNLRAAWQPDRNFNLAISIRGNSICMFIVDLLKIIERIIYPEFYACQWLFIVLLNTILVIIVPG